LIGPSAASRAVLSSGQETTGAGNLYAAVWLRDLEHFYEFLTKDLAALNVDNVDTILVGRDFKRTSPGW
jgi:hypothetical protein